jgi:glycogen operon protein
MLLAGDEMGRTQQGNNNAYCQDNEVSWVDWQLDQSRQDLLAFTQYVIELFHTHPVLRRRKFFFGRQIHGSELKDITWFRPDGKEMTEEDWQNAETRCFGLRLAGDLIEEEDERGNPITDETLLILLNAYHEAVSFVLPSTAPDQPWVLLLDTQEATGRPPQPHIQEGVSYALAGRSLVLLRTTVTAP